MLLEELNSKETKEYRRKQARQVPNSSENSTSSTSDADSETFDESTSDLITSMVSVKPQESPNDYDADSTTTNVPEDFNEPEEEVTSSKPPRRPMMLSEFANHLAEGIRERPETTTQPLPDFPTPKPDVFSASPDEDFPFIVTAAKDFVRRYLSPEQWRKLRILLKTIKEVGGTRRDIHRAATSFISKVISKTEMSEITERKNELFRTFNRRYFDKMGRN